MSLLFLSTSERASVWSKLFAEAGEEMVVGEEAVTDPAAIRHIACWLPPRDLTIYPNLETVICVGAGVDHFPPLPETVTLSRTLASGIEEMVRDWVVMACLMLHRDMPTYLDNAQRGLWQTGVTQRAQNRRVGIMGMGRIGKATADYLAAMGFKVAGWSRSGAPQSGVEVFDHSEFNAFLSRTDILVCLLPLTDATRGLLNAQTFAALPHGAALVQAGRGGHLVMDDLRKALQEGQISSAMLDVTDPEPLPSDHWMWSDPRVILTPHIAAQTDAKEGAEHALNVIRAARAGRAIPGRVDPAKGY